MKRVFFGSLIRQFRLDKGWTQAELAQKLGYESPQFVSLLERDQSKVPLYVLGQLIVLLGIPEDKIIGTLTHQYSESLRTQLSEGKALASGK